MIGAATSEMSVTQVNERIRSLTAKQADLEYELAEMQARAEEAEEVLATASLWEDEFDCEEAVVDIDVFRAWKKRRD